MIDKRLSRGDGRLVARLADLPAYALVTMEEPLALIERDLARPPAAVILNRDTAVDRLDALAAERPAVEVVVGFGGGTACDTAKFLAWKWGLPVIVAPSVLSVDAWLCRSVAVRLDGRVRYVGDIEARELIVDPRLIRQAPPALNRAGVADVLSITTALGDWRIAHLEFGDRFDERVFREARAIADRMLARARDVRELEDAGVDALVQGQLDEVLLCERWGNARPEEGGEHFLCYCLEEITRAHYVHGNLVALGILLVLQLQRDRAQFGADRLRAFFDAAGVEWAPARQGITREDLRRALEGVQAYVAREGLMHGLWSQPTVFDPSGDLSIEGLLDWAYAAG
jgi:glycerol-1-phosphate dehydrogenase [NAD(P)+]